MATNDTVKTLTSAADITEYWLANIAPNYFNIDNVNTYRAGTLGFINDAMATSIEDSMHAMMIARREFYPNTAQYTKSLYTHAASRMMDAPMATPAVATILLMIQQSEILKYGTTDEDMTTFVLDDTFIAYVGDIPFMLDYPINIIAVAKDNGKYAYTTHYDFYIDNTLATSGEKYVPNKVVTYDSTDYLVISVPMRQVYKTYDNRVITTNTIVDTVVLDFTYTGNLANFEIFYKESSTDSKTQMVKYLHDAGIYTDGPFCWYKLVDSSTIRITFPANAYFTPKLNSEVYMEIFTTEGESGNFDGYDADIISENKSTDYTYNTQVPVFGVVDGASEGGEDIMTKEELRSEVLRAYATNYTYITSSDLQTYFDTLMNGTDDAFKFVKKRDDAFIRLYGAFLLMKDDSGVIVPSNTLDITLDPLESVGDFDIYSDAVNRYVIKPGALFTYIAEDGDDKYKLRRVPNATIGSDLSNFDGDGQWMCRSCGYMYESYYSDFESEDDSYVCPHCGAAKDQFYQDTFIFTNPYLINISTDTFMAGYYLNARNDVHDIQYVAVNDESIVQFIARSFTVTRTAITGDNFYRISIKLSPSTSLSTDTIYSANSEYIVAAHNGYVKGITYANNKAVATIVYTGKSTIVDETFVTWTQDIQVSSYVEKVDETFYVCPHCGTRMSVDDWQTCEESEFKVDGEDMACPNCSEVIIANYVETYIDYDYEPGYDLSLEVGDYFVTNDVIATAKPTDLGRIRVMLDLNDIMASDSHRYIPMVLEEAYSDPTEYYVFAAYLSTDDMVDSDLKMSITEGFALTDGSSGINSSMAIPIEDIPMQLHAFYQYRDDDELDIETRNPDHSYSYYNYVNGYSFTNTYSLKDDDSLTLIKSLDHTKGFLDMVERVDDDEEEEEDTTDTDSSGSGGVPDSDCPGCDDESPEDSDYIYLRTTDHANLATTSTDDRYDEDYLCVPIVGSSTSTTTPTTTTTTTTTTTSDSDDTEYAEYGDNFVFSLRNCPLVSASWVKETGNELYIIDALDEHYDEIESVQEYLENGFYIDMKLYNTYGKSKFYKIGNRNSMQTMDSVNISMSFGVSLVFSASSDTFRENFRTYVAEFIEDVDTSDGNGVDIYIMNLIADAKNDFDEIEYLEYYGISDYDYSAQRISIMSDDEILETVSADSFVPELLNIIRTESNGETVPEISIAIIDE